MTLLIASLALAWGPADDHPLPVEERTRLAREFDDAIAKWTKAIEESPKDVQAHSRRGDARFFRGEFAGALADYDRMNELEPGLAPQHWRRGIACFYAGEYGKAAAQFEAYHTHDDVDRENGIWRFLSQAKAQGVEKAREGLLKYKKDDREPFPSVYRLFGGTMTPENVLEEIRSARIEDGEREARLFYANLYIGLNWAVASKADRAEASLREAVANRWAREAGYGPSWMWQVGRLHYEAILRARPKVPSDK
jgi:lipoprotein NlpI